MVSDKKFELFFGLSFYWFFVCGFFFFGGWKFDMAFELFEIVKFDIFGDYLKYWSTICFKRYPIVSLTLWYYEMISQRPFFLGFYRVTPKTTQLSSFRILLTVSKIWILRWVEFEKIKHKNFSFQMYSRIIVTVCF